MWTPQHAEFYHSPTPKNLPAKERGAFIRVRDSVNALHASLFPED